MHKFKYDRSTGLGAHYFDQPSHQSRGFETNPELVRFSIVGTSPTQDLMISALKHGPLHVQVLSRHLLSPSIDSLFLENRSKQGFGGCFSWPRCVLTTEPSSKIHSCHGLKSCSESYIMAFWRAVHRHNLHRQAAEIRHSGQQKTSSVPFSCRVLWT